MKKTLNNLIEEYYKTNESDQSFIKIVDYYLPSINYLVSNYRDKEDMKQEAILKIFNLLKTHKLDNLLNEPEYKIKAYLKISITNFKAKFAFITFLALFFNELIFARPTPRISAA